MGSGAPGIPHSLVRPAHRRAWAALCTGAIRAHARGRPSLAVLSPIGVPAARDLNQASARAGGPKEGWPQ